MSQEDTMPLGHSDGSVDPNTTPKKKVTGRRVFQIFLHILSGLTILAALGVVASHIVVLVSLAKSVDVWQVWARRIYGIIWCALVILVEIKWTPVTRWVLALDVWPIRGAFYAFVGLLALQEAGTVVVDGAMSMGMNALVETASYTTIAVGFLYVAMGAFCLKRFAKPKADDLSKSSDRV